MRSDILDTRQKVKAWNLAMPALQMKIGDIVQVPADACPTCFQRGADHDALKCYHLFPPILRAKAAVAVDCPTCGNIMLEDKLLNDQPVIMCCNPHCPDNGHCFKPPTVRLERLFE